MSTSRRSSTSHVHPSTDFPSTPNTLSEKLAALRERLESRHPQIGRAYDRLVERLSAIDSGAVGPAIGTRLPDFVMPDQSGELVSLKSLLVRGPLIVSFNRGHWCPYCKLDLRELAMGWPKIQGVGGQIVSIMPDTAAFTEAVRIGDALPFPVLSDIDLGYTLSLGLVYWVGTEVADLYRELGIDLQRYHNNDSHFLPLAAKFVVSRDGIVRFRHVDIEFRQRVETAEIVRTITELA